MSISYQEKERIFQLDTPGSSYILGLAEEEGFAGNIYYGRRLRKDDFRYLLRLKEPPFHPSENCRDRNSFLDSFPMEYPGSSGGDYREGAIRICTKSGRRTVLSLYKGH